MKFAGKVGYVIYEETAPGVYQETVVERKYLGDVIQTAWHSQAAANSLNDNSSLNVQVEIIADAFAREHYSEIRYVEYEKSKWKVSAIQIRRPRLILNFGSKYNEQDHGGEPVVIP